MNPDLPPVNGPRGYRPKSIFDSAAAPNPISPQSTGPVPPPKNHRKLIIIVAGAVIVILIVAGVVATTLGKHQVKEQANTNTAQTSNSAAQSAATDFVKDIIDQNYDNAWSKTSQPFQKSTSRAKFDALVGPLATYIGKSAAQTITDQQQSSAVSISGLKQTVSGASYVFELKSQSDQNSVEYLRVNVASLDSNWQVYSLLYQPTQLKADVASTGKYFLSS